MTLFRSCLDSVLGVGSLHGRPQEDLDTEVADTVKPASDEEVLRRLEESCQAREVEPATSVDEEDPMSYFSKLAEKLRENDL